MCMCSEWYEMVVYELVFMDLCSEIEVEECQ